MTCRFILFSIEDSIFFKWTFLLIKLFPLVHVLCTRNLCRLKIVLTKVQPLWLRKDNYLFLILCFKIMENPGFLSEFQNSPDIQILLDMIHGKTSLTSGDLLEMLTMVDPVNTQDRIQVPDTFSLSPRRWLCLLVSASTCFFIFSYMFWLYVFFLHPLSKTHGQSCFFLL